MMEYEMKFCVDCYLPLAIDIANNLLKNTPHKEDLSLRMRPGKSGSFEILRDGELIFSKKNQGRLPKFEDIGIETTNDRNITPVVEKKCSCGGCQ